MVKQCGATMEQWDSDGGTEWCNCRTVLVKKRDNDGGTV